MKLEFSSVLKAEKAENKSVSVTSRRNFALPYLVGLLIFGLAGLGLRFYGISNGLPYIIPADESLIVDAGTHILKTGDFNPRQYFYPSFYIYLQTLVYGLHFVWGAFTGLYHDIVKDWPDKTYDVTSTPGVYWWGRALTALIGTASIGLIYWVVGRIWQDRRVALIAAGLLAFSSLAIENSQYIAFDLPMAALTLLALWPAWVIAERGERRAYSWLGVVSGLAISTKWNAALILVLGLTAHLLYLGRERRLHRFFNLNLLLLIALTALTTLATTPYLLAEMRSYTNGFLFNLERYQLSQGALSSDTPWFSTLQVIWNDSALAALLMAGGVLLAFFRHNSRDVLLLVFPLSYLLYFNGLRLVYPRNVLPLTYYGAIFAALFVVWAYEKFLVSSFWFLVKKRGRLAQTSASLTQNSKLKTQNSLIPLVGLVLLIVVVMFGPIRNSLYGGWFNSQPFSYARVGEWLERQAGPGPLKLAELRSQQWPGGYPNLFAVRDDPTKIGNQADAHPLAYYRERGIAYLAINEDRAGPFLQSGTGNYPDLFANGTVLEKIETRTVEKPGPPFTILATGVTPETLRLQHPLPTQFGPALNLLGFNLGKVKSENEIYLPPEGPIKSDWPVFKPGEIMGLSVYWQPRQRLERDYVVFIHLRPVARPDFNAAARDTPPLLGAYPTSRWKPGEILTDTPNLGLPADLAPGDYNLIMGFYAINPDQSLMPLSLGDGTTSVKLGTVKIG